MRQFFWVPRDEIEWKLIHVADPVIRGFKLKGWGYSLSKKKAGTSGLLDLFLIFISLQLFSSQRFLHQSEW